MRFATSGIRAAVLAALWTLAAPARADGPPGDLPRWCGGVNGQTETSGLGIDEDAKNTGYATDKVARDIARGACAWRNHADETQKLRERAAAGRAKLVAATGLSDAETDELLALEVDPRRATTENDAFCKATKLDEDDATAHEVSRAKALRYLVCSQDYGAGEYDWPDISEIEKVALVHNCLRDVIASFSSDSDRSARQPWQMLQFATCNALATRIDAKKFAAEVAADKRFNRYAALWAKATLTDTLRRIGVATARYRKIAAKKPELEELLFTAPEKGYAGFLALYDANKAVIDQAALLLAGANKPKRLAKTHAGCAATFEPLLAKAIAAKHATDEAAVELAFRDTFVHYVGAAFAVCEAIDGHELAASTYAERMRAEPAPMAPLDAARTAALQVMFANADEIDGVRDLTVQHPAQGVHLDVSPPPSAEARGVIASVAPAKGDLVKVSFKKETWVEERFDCRETNRIDRIDDRGKIVYRQSCTPAGTQKRELKEAPVLVDKRFAGALAPGRFLEMRVTESAEREAMPLGVYAGKDKKVLKGYLGFAL